MIHEDTALSPYFHFQPGNANNVVDSVELDANVCVNLGFKENH